MYSLYQYKKGVELMSHSMYLRFPNKISFPVILQYKTLPFILVCLFIIIYDTQGPVAFLTNNAYNQLFIVELFVNTREHRYLKSTKVTGIPKWVHVVMMVQDDSR